MRELVVTQNVTLDGVIEATGGWFDPAADAEADQDDVLAELRQQAAASDAVLFGRVTFEEMRSYWPHQTDDPSGVAAHLNAVRKYVVSGTLGDPGWAGTTVLRGPLTEEIRAVKALPGKAIVATGSITLVHGLIAAGLVDEYRLFVYPVALGRGARLFPDADAPLPLRLVENRAFRSGITLLRYRPT